MFIIPDNKYEEKIAIVVVGYNRIKSIRRLLDSLLNAKYPNNSVPLVISIDCSGDKELYHYVNDFIWPFGDKLVNIQNVRLGLLQHIYQCGDLTRYFKAIILLEDDLFVSPYFYRYTQKVVEKYGSCPEVAEISLYKNEMNGFVGLPFDIIQNGQDVFLHQDVSTWGECWTKSMWEAFSKWRNSHSEDDIILVDMPPQIKEYKRAWSKYYNAYVVETGKYVVYPNISLTTNFSDAGEHGGNNNAIVQVNLQQEDFVYRLGDIDLLAKYDIYGNNEAIYEWLNFSKEDVRLDIYGFYSKCDDHKFILSTRNLPYKIVKSFALNMRPMELNIKYNITGEGISLYDTRVLAKRDCKYLPEVVPYMLKGFNNRLIANHLFRHIMKSLLRKIGC